MDRRTLRYGRRGASSVEVLDYEDIEVLEDTGRRMRPRPLLHRYPPAITDRELSRLVDDCTDELCGLYSRWSPALR